MPPADMQRLHLLQDVQFRLPGRIQIVEPTASTLPIFSDDALAALQRGETAESEDHRKWRSLAGWLNDASQDASKAVVLCRRTALTITVTARVAADMAADVQLLPLAGEPQGQIRWIAGAAEGAQPLTAMLDVSNRKLTLLLKFADDDAGRALYGNMVAVLTDTAAKATAVVSCTHSYAHRVTAPTGPRGPRGGRPDLIDVRPDIGVIRPVDMRMAEPAARHRMVVQPDAPRVAPDAVMHAHVLRADVNPARVNPEVVDPAPAIDGPMVIRLDRVARLPLEADVVNRSRIIRGPIFIPTGPAETSVANGSFTVTTRMMVQRRREDVAVFPDLPRQARNGWDQVPNRPAGRPALHFRDSDQVASFFYLPTRFKIGYGVDTDESGRPPMRAEAFRDAQGEPQVKVTLVALPFIETSDREQLRTYLRESVLVNQVPFVRLTPAAGVRARFVADFTAGAADDMSTLPASIRFETLEVAPEKWLILQFTMHAADYAIFGALLQKGLRGRVVLETEGVSQSVPVSLELSDVVTDALRVRPSATDATDLVVENLLALPATMSSVRASLLDTGSAGLIFDAEELDLVSQAQRLDAKATWSTRVNPVRITGWDETVVSMGPVRVEGGAPEEWLNRVNRDPSLQPQSFRVSVSLTVPSANADRLELVQLRLFRDGENAPRQQVRMLPGGGPLELVVQMTLAELMGRQGRSESFYLEYESLHKDGTLSLPQRVSIRLEERNLVLLALVETPTSIFTVDYEAADGMHREELTRAAAVTLIERLKSEGRRWQVYGRQPAPQPTDPTPTNNHTDTTAPTVSIVTDLLTPAFAAGTIKKVFVVVQAATTGAAKTTLILQPNDHTGKSWRPADGTIPPFKYEVTYLYANDETRKVEGTEATLVLLLDPPRLT